MSSPEVSVLIVSTNIRDDLAGCLRSLRRVADEAEFEVIVVDNASSDGTPELVASEFPEVRLHRADRNLGFAAAMNVALRLARGEFLFALNPDTLLPRAALTRLRGFLQEHPQTAVVGAQLTSPDGFPQASSFTDPGLAKEFLNLLPEIKRVLRPRELVRALSPLSRRGETGPPRRVACVSGGAFLARTRAIWDIGGFDEAFFVYHEDMDICRRLRKAGWEVWSLPAAQVIHYDARTTGYNPYRFPHAPVLEWRLRGMDHYWRKHRSRVAHRAWRCQTRALLNVRILVNYVGEVTGIGGRSRRRRRREELLSARRLLCGS